MTQPILLYAYAGPAYPAHPAEWKGDGFEHEPETDWITGAFRLVEGEPAAELIVIGNGEQPEKFWKVDCDEWAARST